MIGSARTRGGLLGAFVLGQLLAFGLFLGCLWWVTRQIAFVFESHRILVSVGNQQQLGSTLIRQLGMFAAAAWFLHALLGIAAVVLALLTERAFPRGIGARRSWLVAGWFMLLTGLALAGNSTLHPSSVFSGDDSWWRVPQFGFLPVEIALGLTGFLVAVLLVRAAPQFSARGRAAGFVTVAAAGAAAFLLASPRLLSATSTPVASDRPNVVILGIDSLRNDLQVPHRGVARVPAIRAFLADSVRFTDASTPLARTYPSWISILTGRHPTATNARYNLMARSSVHPGETLGDALRAHGYRAIYATDEVRFANIDRSFGFDQVVTPPIGASDFILGYAGDLPLVNLFVRTRAGGWLFPSNYANRAAAITYLPEQFLGRIEREIAIDGPTFLAIHLTLAHWPYAWAGMEQPTTPEKYRDAYALAVTTVDRQFAAVLSILREKHVLDNAIVVVLSDHGEALGAQDDSMLRTIGSGTEIWNSLWGHGTSVMSPNQYHTVLAMRAFGRATLPGVTGTRDWPVSLEDLRPTLEEIATGRAPEHVDGHSLVPYLAGTRDAAELASRIRFTETDFNTPSTKAGRYAASGVFEEAASYYDLDLASGWVHLRTDRMSELLAQKERAAFSSHSLLGALPGTAGGPMRYLLTDRENPHPRLLTGPPDARKDPEARRLWDALQARFPGELAAVAQLPRM
jgi:hypothetical protein